MPKKIRIGIFGAGAMARKHLEAYREITGIAAARPKNLKKTASEFGIHPFADSDTLLREIDAADICLPTFLHESAAAAAAGAGVHAICEKPISLDPRAAERMIRAARRAGVFLMIAHCLRFWPEYTLLRDTVRTRRHGKLLSFHGWRYNCLPAWSSRNWLLDDEKSGGPTVDLHIHDADMILYLLGPPESVRASEISTRLVRSVNSEFSYPDGLRASAAAGWYFTENFPFSMGYRAVFERAVIEYHSRNKPPVIIHRPGKEPLRPKCAQTDGYREELRYFVKCVKENTAPSQSAAEDALASLRMVLAARRSAASGRAERLKRGTGFRV